MMWFVTSVAFVAAAGSAAAAVVEVGAALVVLWWPCLWSRLWLWPWQ